MARLTPAQISTVSAWVAEGATLSQIQERLSTQLEVSMTYMDVRFLVDDLNLALIEKEEPAKPEEVATEAVAADSTAPVAPPASSPSKSTLSPSRMPWLVDTSLSPTAKRPIGISIIRVAPGWPHARLAIAPRLKTSQTSRPSWTPLSVRPDTEHLARLQDCFRKDEVRRTRQL